jgi:hypothetical protein
MTLMRDPQPAEFGTGSQNVRLGRIIAVGVRDHTYDAATLAWAEHEAVPGADALHLVHAYVPLRLDGCTWDPVRRERDARALLGRRVTAQAVQRARTACPGVLVDGSTIQGLPADVLHEFSAVADVLVIGDDSIDPTEVRKIAWRVQDHARCPVVSVPRHYEPSKADEPVTVVVDETGLAESAMRFAAREAIRHDVTLQVSRSWTSLHEGDKDGATWLAHQQEELDSQVADWRDRYPQLPIVARIELDDDWLVRVAARSSLLVAPVRAAPLLRSGAGASGCPTAIVPRADVTRS